MYHESLQANLIMGQLVHLKFLNHRFNRQVDRQVDRQTEHVSSNLSGQKQGSKLVKASGADFKPFLPLPPICKIFSHHIYTDLKNDEI